MRRLLLSLTLLVAPLALAQDVPRPHLLVVNDDGIDAAGLAALVDAMREDWRITVCAPASDQSGVGNAISYRAPVLVEEQPGNDGIRRYAIHAYPATCARIALTALLAGDPPDLVVSGINRGTNTGRSPWVSGTVGAAREAASVGFPAVALSAARPRGGEPEWTAVVAWARDVLHRLRAAHLPPPGGLVNINIPHPATAARGVAIARLDLAPAEEERYVERSGPNGERLFVSVYKAPKRGAPGTDVEALAQGWITVTPLSLDQTAYRQLWDFLPIRFGDDPLAAGTTAAAGAGGAGE